MKIEDTGETRRLELAAVLREINEGKRALTCYAPERPARLFTNIPYHADGRWVLVVFNDCGSWDYLDSVVCPDGVVLDYKDIYWQCLEIDQPTPGHLAVIEAEPTDEEVWKVWGISGLRHGVEEEWEHWKPVASWTEFRERFGKIPGIHRM